MFCTLKIYYKLKYRKKFLCDIFPKRFLRKIYLFCSVKASAATKGSPDISGFEVPEGTKGTSSDGLAEK